MAHWHHGASQVWVDIERDNGLLPDAAKNYYLNQCQLYCSEETLVNFDWPKKQILFSAILSRRQCAETGSSGAYQGWGY